MMRNYALDWRRKQKRYMIILLAMVLICNTVSPAFSAYAAEEATPLSNTGGTLSAGNYILLEDIKLKNSISIKNGSANAVTIDLNGHVLEGPGAASVIKNDGYLTIKDSQSDAGGRWFKIREDGPWEMVSQEPGADTTGYRFIKGGIITGGHDKTAADSGSSGGGAIKMGANDVSKSDRLYLEGGTLVGNSSTRAGGAVYGGSIWMSGGTVVGNYADSFGGGLSLSGSLEMSGGLVELNHTSASSKYNKPTNSAFYDFANVIIGYQSQFTMTGGTIRGNVSTVYNTGNKAPNFDISGGLIEGNFRLLNKLTATFSGGELVGYIYMKQGGTCNIEGEALIHGGSRDNGGGVCMQNGTFNMSGGTIENAEATETGGAIYIGSGECNISGGTIQNCSANQGGAISMDAGTCNVSGDAVIQNCYATEDGGAVYMGGGNVDVSGGSVLNNTAERNGGGIAVNNGNYEMTGGAVEGNKALNGAGGGIYVSAETQDVEVNVFSGSVSNNTAKGNGGAFAVIGNASGEESVAVTVGVNKQHYDKTSGDLLTNCEHGAEGECAYDCPVLQGNQSGASGGGIYVTGNNNKTSLNIYCLEESGSTAAGDNGQSNFMKVDGGTVLITTSEQQSEDAQNSYYGNTLITTEVYVTGGVMDLWGQMTNPRLEDIITVDITKEGDRFTDHRSAEGETYYKLIYFENFTDPFTNVTTGQYKELEVKHGSNVAISGNIYSHPGYTIKGWNTSNGRPDLDDYPAGEGPEGDSSGWYTVGQEYLFDGEQIGDLTIYAIWEANGYTVKYNPNVPSGETYTGTMEDDNFTYNVATALSKNQYVRPGYDFVGWSKAKDGTGEIYQDEQEVTDLTSKQGEAVTLYAQWKECDHNTETHIYTYKVVDEGRTLRRDCSCGVYTEEVRLSAEDAVYDQKNHGATVTHTSDKWTPNTIEYTAADVNDVLVNNEPYHAGDYTATLTENGYTISVTYTIEKAEQQPPEQPVFNTDLEADGSLLSVKAVADSPLLQQDDTYTSHAEYRIYYEGASQDHVTWREGNEEGEFAVQYELDKALTNYYVQARYSECDNYKASPIVSADSVYFFAGDVKVTVKNGEGVKYQLVEADGSNVQANGINLLLSTEEGYFFPSDYKVEILTEEAENNAQAKIEFLSGDGSARDYRIGDIPNGCKITITLGDAQSKLTIASKITEKQIFGTVTTDTATISRDSAYTIYFDVNQYYIEDYTGLKLSFDRKVPAGTTIIMNDKGQGLFYWILVEEEDQKAFELTEFVLMGDASQRTFVERDGNLDLQFVVDFSQVEGGITGEALTTTLSADAENTGAMGEQSGKSAALKNKASYTLTGSNGVVDFKQSKSEGVASILENRDAALVFIPSDKLPEDALLSIAYGNTTREVYANCDGNYIYSMPTDAEGVIRASIISNLLDGEAASYDFDVKWMIAKSKEEFSPMNGTEVANTDLTITYNKKSPISIKVSGDKKLYKTDGTVQTTVAWADLTESHKLQVVLMRKTDSGVYSSTGVTKTITSHKLSADAGAEVLEISLRGNTAGSYKLHLTATLGLVTEAEAEYYFIVEE